MVPVTATGPLESAGLVGFVASSDLDRSRAFYADLLGLRVLEQNPAACVLASGAVTVRVTLVPEVSVAPYTVLGFTVPDVGLAVDQLGGRGVAFARFDGMAQDGRGVWTTPGGDLVAWFRDPDGHLLSLTELAG
jgi:catechol 2,3-dioxygenase-like lactoylglutathione lyase family enzyme